MTNKNQVGMRKILLYSLSLLLAGLGVSSCATDAIEDALTPQAVSNAVKVTFSSDLAQTRTDFTYNKTDEGKFNIDIQWNDADALALYGTDGTFKKMEYQGQDVFKAAGWQRKAEAKYAIFYPYSASENDPGAISIDFTGQTQHGYGNTEHLGQKYYMASGYASAAPDEDLNMTLYKLAVPLRLRFEFSRALEGSKVEKITLRVLESQDQNRDLFLTKADVKLTENGPVVDETNATFADEISLSVTDGESAAFGQTADFYLMMYRTDRLADALLGVYVNDGEEPLRYIYGKDLSSGDYAGFGQPVDIIRFSDDAVKAICVANWDKDGDGELSYYEAESVTSLEGKFTNNTDITFFDELRFFTGLTALADNEFDCCFNLQYIELPNSLKSIGANAFGTLPMLRHIYIPEGVESIGEGVFAFNKNKHNGSSQLEAVGLPSTLTSISKLAFQNCVALTALDFTYVEEIGSFAFDNSGLEEVVITHDVKLGKHVFKNSLNLRKAVFQGDIINAVTDSYQQEDYNIFDIWDENQEKWVPTTIGEVISKYHLPEFTFKGCKALEEVVLPNSLEVIGLSAFRESGLREVTIPDNLIVVGKEAFEDCVNLEKVVFAEQKKLKTIDRLAFKGCLAWKEDVVLPDGLTRLLTKSLFMTGVKKVVIPSTIYKITSQAIDKCPNLTSITILKAAADRPMLDGKIFLAHKYCFGYRGAKRAYGGGYADLGSSAFPDEPLTNPKLESIYVRKNSDMKWYVFYALNFSTLLVKELDY